jgi:hypothetical protein
MSPSTFDIGPQPKLEISKLKGDPWLENEAFRDSTGQSGTIFARDSQTNAKISPILRALYDGVSQLKRILSMTV